MAFYIGVYAYAIIVHTRADQLLLQLLMEQFDTCLYNVDTLKICMKEFGQKKNIRQNNLYENLDNFSCIIIYADSTCMGQSTPTTAFDELIQYLTYTIHA